MLNSPTSTPRNAIAAVWSLPHTFAAQRAAKSASASPAGASSTHGYLYRWDRQGRKGQPCNVLARGTMNSCLLRFADGFTNGDEPQRYSTYMMPDGYPHRPTCTTIEKGTDMDATPPAIIEIKTTERRDIRAEVIEHVARIMCRADGCEPDADIRSVGDAFRTVHIPYPENRGWFRYRDQAITKLQELFKAPEAEPSNRPSPLNPRGEK